MPMGHFPIPISDMGDENWEMAHWHMVRVFGVALLSVVGNGDRLVRPDDEHSDEHKYHACQLRHRRTLAQQKPSCDQGNDRRHVIEYRRVSHANSSQRVSPYEI